MCECKAEADVSWKTVCQGKKATLAYNRNQQQAHILRMTAVYLPAVELQLKSVVRA